jgi:hypothetical protein
MNLHDAQQNFARIYFNHKHGNLDCKCVSKESGEQLWNKCFVCDFFDVIRGFSDRYIILYFLFVVTHGYSYDINVKKSLFESKDFKMFIKKFNVLENFEKDKTILMNIKSFKDLQKAWYTKKISDIGFYVCMRCLYKEYIENMEQSNLYKFFWFKLKLIGSTIKYNSKEQEIIKEWCTQEKERMYGRNK